MTERPRFEPAFEIAGRPVGGGAPCYVIAEAGANHNRDLGVARELIDVAAEAGADAVKFQTYTGKDLYSSRTPRFTYLDDERSPQELLDAIALPREWQPLLAEHAATRGIHFFSSPFDRAAVDSLAELGVPAMKIASFELVDLPLIRHAAAVGVPIVLSTGMATYGEVEDALGAVAETGNRRAALLRCASTYPAPPEIMNLRAMATMRTAFGVPVGLSDHTTGVTVAAGAAALGAEVYEKHFTLSRAMEGPDHPFALEPDELRAMVAGIREVEAALGHGRLEGPSEPEAGEMYQLARRSVIAAADIPAGTAITAEMLTVKRPGYGIAPKHLELVVGRVARVDIPFDEVVTWDMV
ncbi:MAG TPA: N-acetylneuraminate synthase family protein [Capillimicrobium sp.]